MSPQLASTVSDTLEGSVTLRTVGVRAPFQWVIWLIIWIVIGLALGSSQFTKKNTLIEQQTELLLSQNRVTSLLVRTQVQSADTALEAVQRSLTLWLRSSEKGRQLANFHFGNFVDLLPAIRTISVLDENGVFTFSNRQLFIGQNYFEREYFQEIIRSKSPKTVYISKPYRTASNTWVINISRCLFDEEGVFRGAIVATLDPKYFTSLMQRMHYARDVSMSLLHESGELYVTSRYLANNDEAKQSNVDTDIFHQHIHSGNEITIEPAASRTSKAGPTLQVATTVELKDFGADNDFVVISSRDHNGFLLDWKKETQNISTAFFILLIISGAALLSYQRWAVKIKAQAKKTSEDLVKMAFHDPLTDAYNRRAFLNSLDIELERSRRANEKSCLLMLDIDRFKLVNDKYGHDFGDVVLQNFVQTIRSKLRRIDVLGRLGGEEFSILLPATEITGAIELAERLRETIESSPISLPDSIRKSLDTQQETLSVTASIGVTALHPDEKVETINLALKRADQAMYLAKETGRNKVCVIE